MCRGDNQLMAFSVLGKWMVDVDFVQLLVCIELNYVPRTESTFLFNSWWNFEHILWIRFNLKSGKTTRIVNIWKSEQFAVLLVRINNPCRKKSNSNSWLIEKLHETECLVGTLITLLMLSLWEFIKKSNHWNEQFFWDYCWFTEMFFFCFSALNWNNLCVPMWYTMNWRIFLQFLYAIRIYIFERFEMSM